MSLFDLFRKPAVWSVWPQSTPRPMVYDLQSTSLDGVVFDAPLAALEAFGQPTNSNPLKSGSFVVAPLGLDIIVDREGSVLSYTCVFSSSCSGAEPARFESFSPCQLVILNGPQEITITEGTDRTSIERALGQLSPEEIHGEVLHALRADSTQFYFMFDDAGGILLVDVEPS